VMHRALERLYGERPGGDAVPRPASLDAWIRRGAELVTEAANEQGLSPTHPADVAIRRRTERLLAAFLRREAGRPPLLQPALLEASFGSEEGADRPSLDLGGWMLHGRIDRVDSDGTVALLHDYKMSREVTSAAKLEKEGKLQLQLYLIAVRDLWGLEPAAGLYQPLRATKEPRGRGIARASDREAALAGWSLFDKDVLEDSEFDRALADARERATGIVGRIRGGDIRRDPLEDECPKYCTYAPICRRERGLIADPEAELREEEK
jgi:RecB family exonuclease